MYNCSLWLSVAIDKNYYPVESAIHLSYNRPLFFRLWYGRIFFALILSAPEHHKVRLPIFEPTYIVFGRTHITWSLHNFFQKLPDKTADIGMTGSLKPSGELILFFLVLPSLSFTFGAGSRGGAILPLVLFSLPSPPGVCDSDC